MTSQHPDISHTSAFLFGRKKRFSWTIWLLNGKTETISRDIPPAQALKNEKMWRVKLRSHLLPAEPRTIPVSYRDKPGRSGVKLLLWSHLPRQHYGNFQITIEDALRIIQAEPRWSYGSCRCFPGRSRMTLEEPRLTQAEPRSIQVEPRQSPGQSRQSLGRTPVDSKRAKMITLIHYFYLI
jgi:hypothetical protein